MYFFLYPENFDHLREVDNIENLIAYLGGLTEILIVSFIGLTTIFNQQSIVSKYLRKLYITPINENLEPHMRSKTCVENKDWKTLVFSIFDKYSFMKDYIPYGEDDELLNRENKLWKYSYKKFGDELNAITLL